MYTKAVLNNSQNHGTLYLPIICTLSCKWDETSRQGTNGRRWWHGNALHLSSKSSNSVLQVKNNFRLLSTICLSLSVVVLTENSEMRCTRRIFQITIHLLILLPLMMSKISLRYKRIIKYIIEHFLNKSKMSCNWESEIPQHPWRQSSKF